MTKMETISSRMGKYQFDEEKLKELIIYISGRCRDDKKFAATKLNKILYYSDFCAFIKQGRPITGAEYQRFDHGPVPKQLLKAREDLLENRDIAVSNASYHGHTQNRIVPLRDPDFNKIGSQEIAIVDDVIEILSPFNASQVSRLSHSRAWRIAGEKNTIPYEAAFISDDPPSDYEVNLAVKLNNIYEWE